MNSMKWAYLILPLSMCGRTSGQTVAIQVQPQVAGRAIRDGQVTTVYLAPRYATTIRMPEPVNSVVVGDPASFAAEHSEKEPNLVFVKPVTTKPAQTNLLISTTRGLQASLLLLSRGEPRLGERDAVDFLLRYKPAGQFVIQPADSPSAVVPQTATVAAKTAASNVATAPIAPIGPASLQDRVGMNGERAGVSDSNKPKRDPLDDLLDRQRRAPLPILYGQKPGISPPAREHVKAGVSEVIDQGREVVVLFSVVNAQDHPIELTPPQIQLGGKQKSGKIVRKSRWSTSEQFPILAFRLSQRRLGPGERADGVVLFERPAFKQSIETLFLQMAESGAVDRPALAPIGFGISSFREVAHDAR